MSDRAEIVQRLLWHGASTAARDAGVTGPLEVARAMGARRAAAPLERVAEDPLARTAGTAFAGR